MASAWTAPVPARAEAKSHHWLPIVRSDTTSGETTERLFWNVSSRLNPAPASTPHMKQRAAPPFRKKKKPTIMPFQNSSFRGATTESTLRSKAMPQPVGTEGRLRVSSKASPLPFAWISHAAPMTR